jgi:hypothetical protein
MTDGLERVLRLVAEGRLTADEAAPILDALSAAGSKTSTTSGSSSSRGATSDSNSRDQGASGQRPRVARLEVRENGRRVVDLRIPISLGRLALNRVPGLSREQVDAVEQAVGSGSFGPVLDVEDADGGGVRIVLE